MPALLLALSIQLMGILSPGPGVMLILGVATSRGRDASLITALGIACGSMVLAIATVIGVTAILAGLANAMTVLRWIGAAYLIWLGCKSLKTAWKNPPLPEIAETDERPIRTALTGFGLQVTNPKAIGFWLAIAAVGGIGEAPMPIVILFVIMAGLNSFIGHGAYAVALSSSPIRASYGRFRRWIDGTLGSLFLLAGLRLAASK
ncbi:MAG: LysE family translocator [Pseudomonadota bacterium]